MRYTCPSFSVILINCYRVCARLFIAGGAEVSSEEGTTQGDPLAMAFYALSVVPLIHILRGITTQVWFADDAAAAAKLSDLRKYWDLLVLKGPAYGYYPKPSKTFLIIKDGLEEQARLIFQGTGVKITPDGQEHAHERGGRHLGGALGSEAFVEAYVKKKVAKWSEQVELLAGVAKTEPHAAYAGFIFGLRPRNAQSPA